MPIEALETRIPKSKGIIASERISDSDELRRVFAQALEVSRDDIDRVILANCGNLAARLGEVLAISQAVGKKLPPVLVDIAGLLEGDTVSPDERRILEFLMASRERFAGVAAICPDKYQDGLRAVAPGMPIVLNKTPKAIAEFVRKSTV
ncbi:MAG: hypothetical protein UV80_C0007G0053 [Candidatus Peregrinibacteria bacterium GW2011_GWF2_43_17]|nr:MAG: hypothetical protein UV80_C0007G0053 [Candidatus Peregrinibacteria bacterium GW2011_GWF2_43_17]KKT19188.1 MAG: hypothetical protein UW03_C0022G0004 [Candidatus Peregrinibacteria bacterium GW2011_GWA2_43_8]HAU39595.1 hypothetical protein [Candidatus Peregrinibacteria bacterium]